MRKVWKKFLAGVLTAGILLAETPVALYADEAVSNEQAEQTQQEAIASEQETERVETESTEIKNTETEDSESTEIEAKTEDSESTEAEAKAEDSETTESEAKAEGSETTETEDKAEDLETTESEAKTENSETTESETEDVEETEELEVVKEEKLEVEKAKASTYTISFNGNGNSSGSMKGMTNCVVGKKVNLPANKFKKENCTFCGWNTAKDGTGQSYQDGQKEVLLPAKANGTVTLYAQWRWNKYKVKFYGNHSTSGSTKALNCKVTKSYNLTANGFKRTGYKFSGWNTKADGTGKSYSNKQSIKNLSKKDGATVKLYAQWKQTKYTIQYKLNGGTNHKSNPASYTIKTNTIQLKDPTCAGCVFQGWYLDSKFSKQVKEIPKGSTGNKTLYAKWSRNKYTIAFDGNGGNGTVSSIKAACGKTYQLPLCGFVRNGYYCAGWNTKADGTGKTYKTLANVKNLTTKNGKTVTLYVQWNEYSKTEISMAKDVVKLVKAERKKAGVGTIQTDSELTAIAQQRAKEIAEYYSHDRPDKTSSWYTLYQSSGYQYKSAGENIAYGYKNADSVMAAWMDSLGHKGNILDASYTKIGVGCYYLDGRYYWVQNFSN